MKIDNEPGKTVVDRSGDYCCCGRMHVETGAKTVAIIGAILSALVLLPGISKAAFIYAGIRYYLFSMRLLRRPFITAMSLGAFTNLLVWSLVFVAVRRRKPGLYVPYLILHAILISANTMCICRSFLLLFCMGPDEESAIRERFHGVEPIVLAGAAFVVDVVTEVTLVWSWSVVAKSYRFAMMYNTILTGISSLPYFL